MHSTIVMSFAFRVIGTQVVATLIVQPGIDMNRP
jgi:hypothetical protein